MNELKQFGANPLPPDEHDFKLGAVFKLPALSEIPDNFRLMPLGIKDQGDSDLCTAYASCGASELQELVELNPEYSFALSKELSGDPDAWGQDLRKAMHAHQKFGAIEESQARPFINKFLEDHPDNGRQLLRQIHYWPAEFKDLALKHAKGSFMAITGPYDAFDNIRATLWMFRNEDRAAVFGVRFGWELSQHFMTEPQENGFGHAMYDIGFERVENQDFLVIVASNGKEAGDNGIHYFSRKVINEYVKTYGAFMFVDMTPDEYRKRLQPWIVRVLQASVAFLERLVREKQAQAPKPAPAPVVPPPTVKQSRIKEWAEFIQDREGYFIPGERSNLPRGSRSFRNKNPGNLKFTGYTQTLGAIGKDDEGHCIFESYRDGFQALCQFLTDAAGNKLIGYHNVDLLKFFERYAENHVDYAIQASKRLQVGVHTPIKELL